MTVPVPVRQWIERVTGQRPVAWRRLPGASSSAVHAVRLTGPAPDDQGPVLVLRRWTWRWLLDDEPEIVQRELDALAVAERAGLPAPRVVAADPTGEDVGDGVPVLLMTRVAGRAVADPDLEQVARTAAAIHDVAAPDLPHRFFRWNLTALTGPPAGAPEPDLWTRALALRESALPRYELRFIHRDFHPGNVLVRRGRVTGVVDWALTCLGPWECDVATCRSNLRRLGGPAPAEEFRARYCALTGRRFDPYWDLNYLLENQPEHWTPDTVRRTEPLLRGLVDRVGAGA